MRLLCLTFLVTLTLSSFSQNQTVSGRLTDDTGESLPGVNIVIKGTRVGTITDLDGYYQLSAPTGSILVFSFVGFETQEMVVTEDMPSGLKRVRSRSQGKFVRLHFPTELINDSISNQIGVGFFGNDSKTYKSYSSININKISRVTEKKNQFSIKSWGGQSVRKGRGFQYSQVFGVLKVTQLPKVQSIFSQGRPNNGALEWLGPESNELFSWGPRISNLEFDGSSYPYDLNGRLVTVGSGNGISGKNYDNLNLFRDGFINTHDFLFTHTISRNGDIIAGINWENQTSILPNGGKEKLSANIDLENISLSPNSSITFRSLYSNSKGSLLSHGANLSRIIADVHSVPATFDNSNNLSRKEASTNPDSYSVALGQVRSFAPGIANNPFGIVSTTRDSDELSNFFSALEYEWSYEPNDKSYWELNVKSSYDKQKVNSTFGVPFGYAGAPNGLFVRRLDEKNQFDLRVTPSYELSKRYPFWDLTFTLDYYLSTTTRSLERENGIDFSFSAPFELNEANSINSLYRELDRTSHQLSYSTKFDMNHFTINVGNSHYFSSTIDQVNFKNFSPFIGISGRIYVYPFILLPKAGYSKAVQESSLIYNDWAYNSTSSQSGDFREVNETSELLFNEFLKPEITSKIEFDLETRLEFFYRLNLRFTYSYETLDNFIAPVAELNQFNLENVATVANESVKIVLGYFDGSWSDLWWSVSTRWTKNSPKVIKTNSADPIPLAGFNHVFSSLSEGQPFGAIYGTFYERDLYNNLVIDSDGYPITSGQVKEIANPNPEWIVGIDGSIQWRNIKLNTLFEYIHGGSVWNGTAAYLDYIGRSHETGELRETTDFIFDGVDQNGSTNSILVNFLDPDQDISQSRWVRYGPEGVADDYIEDASSFRLSELTFGYSIPIPEGARLKELSFSLIGRNLFQITPYTGVDPQSSLFGYSLGRGLDMFNMPSTRSYQLKMIVKL